MTVLLDAFAVIAVLRGEPSASEVRPHLENEQARLHPLNLAEVIDRMVRRGAADADEIEGDIALLGITATEAIAADLVDAGRWRARHYHRTDFPVSLADCVASITAVRSGQPLATSDIYCAELVWSEGGEVVPLPNSAGHRPKRQ